MKNSFKMVDLICFYIFGFHVNSFINDYLMEAAKILKISITFKSSAFASPFKTQFGFLQNLQTFVPQNY